MQDTPTTQDVFSLWESSQLPISLHTCKWLFFTLFIHSLGSTFLLPVKRGTNYRDPNEIQEQRMKFLIVKQSIDNQQFPIIFTTVVFLSSLPTS